MDIMETAPELCLPDLDGKSHCLADYLGKVVFINFWSAECPLSASVDEAMSAYEASLEGQVVFLRIASNRNESLEALKQASTARGVSPILWDAQQEVADRYAARTTPHCFLVDGQGVLRYQGAYDDVSFRQRSATQQFAKDALKSLLDGREPHTPTTQPYGCTIMRHLPDSC
jgi:thiol-disulfide isomerase/thioredoxin